MAKALTIKLPGLGSTISSRPGSGSLGSPLSSGHPLVDAEDTDIRAAAQVNQGTLLITLSPGPGIPTGAQYMHLRRALDFGRDSGPDLGPP